MGEFSSFTFFGLNFFDLVDWISANLLLPIGGLFIALFTGWYLGRKKVQAELAMGGKMSEELMSVFIFLVKFISPIAIAIVLLNKVGLLNFG